MTETLCAVRTDRRETVVSVLRGRGGPEFLFIPGHHAPGAGLERRLLGCGPFIRPDRRFSPSQTTSGSQRDGCGNHRGGLQKVWSPRKEHSICVLSRPSSSMTPAVSTSVALRTGWRSTTLTMTPCRRLESEAKLSGSSVVDTCVCGF